MHVGFFSNKMSTPKHNQRIGSFSSSSSSSFEQCGYTLIFRLTSKYVKHFSSLIHPFRNVARVSICLMIVSRSIDFWHLDLPFCSFASLKLMFCQIRERERRKAMQSVRQKFPFDRNFSHT